MSLPSTVSFEGEIDLSESPRVFDQLGPLIEKRAPSVQVDLSRVTYIDSSGLAALIDAMQRVRAYGGEFALVGLRANVRKIFEIARLDQVFTIR